MAIINQNQQQKNQKTPIIQTTHGFSVGDVVYFDGANYILANSSNPATIGEYIISEVVDADTFFLAEALEVVNIPAGIPTLVDTLSPAPAAGDWLYASFTTAGKYTLTEGSPYSNPMAQVVDANHIRYVPLRAEHKPATMITPTSREQYAANIPNGASHTFTHSPESIPNGRVVQALRQKTMGENIAPQMTPYDPDNFSTRENFLNDESNTIFWYNNSSAGPVGDWFGLDNGAPVTVSAFTLYDYQQNANYFAPDFTFQGSNDGTTWTTITTITGATYSAGGANYTFAPATYQYFRWACDSANDPDWWVVAEVKLFEYLASPQWVVDYNALISFDSPTQITITNTSSDADYLLNIIL